MSTIIIRNALIVTPKDGGMQVFQDGALFIEGSNIIDLGPTKHIMKHYSSKKEIDASGHVAIPGFVDAHIHSHESLLRGLAQDVEESHWMHKTLDPIARYMTKEAAVIGSKLTVLEGLKAGTTSFCDYGHNMEDIVKNVHSPLGVRANVCSTVNEFGTGKRSAGELYEFDSEAGEKKLRIAERLVKDWHGKENGRITCHFGPQAADMMSENLLHSTKELANENRMKVHMHIAQGGRERSQMMKRYGRSTVSYLKSIGYLDENLIAVHCHDANQKEIEELVANGASMIGCPGSIGLIDGMVPPIYEFISGGGVASLGSDQCPPAGHNMFNQLRYVALLTKTKHQDPTLMPTWKIFQLATIDGARCHGLEDRIGSLERGKRADIVLISLNTPSMTPTLNKPIRNLIPNLVYSATGSEVSTVLVDGQIVMEEGIVKTVNERKVLREAQREAERIGELANEDFHKAGSTLSRMMKEGKL